MISFETRINTSKSGSGARSCGCGGVERWADLNYSSLGSEQVAVLSGTSLGDGRLVSVMPEWCPKFPGLHAYYPSRRHSSRALSLVIDTIRHKA
ncbi:MAG: hypothetical protein ACREWI_12600 [Telluria sp.]